MQKSKLTSKSRFSSLLKKMDWEKQAALEALEEAKRAQQRLNEMLEQKLKTINEYEGMIRDMLSDSNIGIGVEQYAITRINIQTSTEELNVLRERYSECAKDVENKNQHVNVIEKKLKKIKEKHQDSLDEQNNENEKTIARNIDELWLNTTWSTKQ